MNFSTPIKYTGISSYSPNTKYFLITRSTEIQIYETASLKFTQKFSFSDLLASVEWSPDSNLILVSFPKRSICEVKSLDNPDWICRIDEGVAGLASCRWSPDSRRIITVCDFNLRLTIWSLIDRSTSFINNPKFANKGMSFTSNGSFMALAERKDCKDYIGIYYVADWTLVSHFQVESSDLQDIVFTRDDSAIVIYDSPLECKLLVYSPTGHVIASHIAYENALGIKSIGLSPSGHYLAVGYFDQAIRIFSCLTWKQVTELNHKASLSDVNTVRTVNLACVQRGAKRYGDLLRRDQESLQV